MRTTKSTTALMSVATLVMLGISGCADTSPPPTAASPSSSAAPTATASPVSIDLAADLAALEVEFDARVGVSAVDTGTDQRVSYRSDERFGYASTYKALAAAEFLHDVPPAEREQVVTWSAADVEAAGYAPVTSEHLDEGLTLSQLTEAAVRQSDNAATNLVITHLGGPSALDQGLEELGDTTTEVVGTEPALNVIEPGSTDDTSTPAAFTADLVAIVDGDRLEEGDRALLLQWMSGNATGDALIRAGAPAGWTVADKSGGAGGIRNDIAVVTPPGRAPVIVTIFTVKNDAAAKYDDALIARTASVVLSAFS